VSKRRWATPEDISSRAWLLDAITRDAAVTENARARAVTVLVERLTDAETAIATLTRELKECRFTIRCLTDGDGRCPALWAGVHRCVRPYDHKESHLTERGCDWTDQL